jgi:hypothetical protein
MLDAKKSLSLLTKAKLVLGVVIALVHAITETGPMPRRISPWEYSGSMSSIASMNHFASIVVGPGKETSVQTVMEECPLEYGFRDLLIKLLGNCGTTDYFLWD